MLSANKEAQATTPGPPLAEPIGREELLALIGMEASPEKVWQSQVVSGWEVGYAFDWGVGFKDYEGEPRGLVFASDFHYAQRHSFEVLALSSYLLLETNEDTADQMACHD